MSGSEFESLTDRGRLCDMREPRASSPFWKWGSMLSEVT